MDFTDAKKALYDILIAAQNEDPNRLNPERDDLLHIIWEKVKAYHFRRIDPCCTVILENALKSGQLAQLTQKAFPF